MAVGPNFQDADTQAAIAAQAAAAEANEPEITADESTQEETPEVTKAAAEASETPPETDNEESAESSTNMDEVAAMSSEEVDKKLAVAGLSTEALTKELVDNDGKISADTVAKLKEHFDADAIDKSIADLEKSYAEEAAPALAEHNAKAEEQNKAINEMNNHIFGSLAGGDIEKGKENLQTLSAWAKANMDPKQLALINKKLASGDKDLVDEGLQQAVSAWKKGQKKPMMSGDALATNKVAQAPAFEPLSKDGFIKLMATEKYQTDPEYAASVDARRAKTLETEGAITPEYSHLRPPI